MWIYHMHTICYNMQLYARYCLALREKEEPKQKDLCCPQGVRWSPESYTWLMTKTTGSFLNIPTEAQSPGGSPGVCTFLNLLQRFRWSAMTVSHPVGKFRCRTSQQVCLPPPQSVLSTWRLSSNCRSFERHSCFSNFSMAPPHLQSAVELSLPLPTLIPPCPMISPFFLFLFISSTDLSLIFQPLGILACALHFSFLSLDCVFIAPVTWCFVSSFI